MKAYSYIRFSKQSQSRGDSYRRQQSRIQKYVTDNNLTLSNENYEDLGISAWKSANAATGALGTFVEAVETGKIETPCTLIVESLDRISRDHVKVALRLFLTLSENEVTLVTLSDNKVYPPDSEMMDLMQAILIFSRGFEESETKSQRVRAANRKQREKTLEGKVKFTGNAPKWLKLNKETQTFEPIPERVEILKRIFQMRLKSYGLVKILKTLNEEGIPAFTMKVIKDKNGEAIKDKHGNPRKEPSKWSQTTISNYLKTKSVIGEYQLHESVRDPITNKYISTPVGDPITDYFPTIISETDFYRVQDTFGKVSKGTTNSFPNPLVGLLQCGLCNGPMKFSEVKPREGRKHKPLQYLRCKSTYEHKTKCHTGSIRFDGVLSTSLLLASYLNYSKINEEDHAKLQGQLSKLKADKEDINIRLNRISKSIQGGLIAPSIIQDANNLSAELNQLNQDIEATIAELSNIEPVSAEAGLTNLETDTPDQRREVNLFLKSYVGKILVFKDKVSLRFLSHQLPEPITAPIGLDTTNPEVISDYIDAADLALNIDKYFDFEPE